MVNGSRVPYGTNPRRCELLTSGKELAPEASTLLSWASVAPLVLPGFTCGHRWDGDRDYFTTVKLCSAILRSPCQISNVQVPGTSSQSLSKV